MEVGDISPSLCRRHQTLLFPPVYALLGLVVAASRAVHAVVFLVGLERPATLAARDLSLSSRLEARVCWSDGGGIDGRGATRGLIAAGKCLTGAAQTLVGVVDAVVLPSAPFASID
jgi:hypothetical protein